MSKPTTCKTCGRKGLVLNRKRVCLSCSMNKNIAVNKQLKAKKGNYYKLWKRNLLNAIK